LVFDRVHASGRLRCTFNLSPHATAHAPTGNRLLETGLVTSDTLGAYGAVIEEQ
jgi:hypothetical protein